MDKKDDERFANIWKDPRFKPVSKKARKVQIDKRFQSMFTDENFKTKFVDKRGRSIRETSTENLKKYYELSSSSEDEKDEEDEESDKELATSEQKCISSFDGADSGSTTSEESDLEVDEDGFDHKWGELNNDAPEIGKPTKRIAVCNMNWDRIKAEDIMVLLNSFKPPDGTIHSVKIYPSEFGIQRMKEEEVKGPKELVEKVLGSDEEDEAETEEGAAYHTEKLRQYQIGRLKYYYAVVECDTPTTASVIYKELDGMEYESSAVTLDLRFVPDDMLFELEPTSQATSLPNMSSYKPSLFTTSALQQIKVNLTWDETDPRRLEAMHSAFAKGKEADAQNVDLSAFLASSSEDEKEEEVAKESTSEMEEMSSKKKKVEKYRELLQSLGKEDDGENKDMELEITWEPDLQKSAKDLVKTKQKNEEMTPWEEYLQKRKEKKKKKQKEKSKTNKDVENSQMDSDKEDESENEETDIIKENEEAKLLELLTGADVKQEDQTIKSKIKKKKKQKLGKKVKETENFCMDVDDPRFSALYTNHMYNIEPDHPQYVASEGTRAIMEEKRKRRKTAEREGPKSGLSEETTDLVSSVKRKTLADSRKRFRQRERTPKISPF